MSKAYDAVIIGAGHNGLVAAAMLAKAGYHVLVLERRDVLGGAAATEEVFPGFRVNTGADDATLFRDEIVRELFLPMVGLEMRESPVALFAPQPDGTALTLWPDVGRSRATIAPFSAADAVRYPDFVREVRRLAQTLERTFLLALPALFRRNLGDAVSWGRVALELRRSGDREMMDLLRALPMPVAAYLDEWFAGDALKGALAGAGVTGTHQGPLAAGTTLMMLYQAGNGFPRRRYVVGGTGRLAAALAAAARHHGAEIRSGAGVTRILVQGGRATGVVVAKEEEISARAVISSATPQHTFFDLAGAFNLPPRFMRQARNIIYRGSTAKVTLALSGLPHFRGQEEEAQLGGHIRISPSVEYLERAYDDAKYGRISARPYLDAVIPTVLDPSLAPEGRHILAITMRYAPYALRDGDWQAQRERLGDLVVDTLAQYAPNLTELILQRQVLTPLDWERRYGLTEGSIFHGQMGLDQMLVLRPVPGWARYRTPLDNLYLCGAGTHPGGGVTGAPGYNAAREVARALENGEQEAR